MLKESTMSASTVLLAYENFNSINALKDLSANNVNFFERETVKTSLSFSKKNNFLE